MEYIKIPLYGKSGKGKYTLVDGDYDGEYFSQYNWKLTPAGYVYRDTYKWEEPKYGSISYLHREVCPSYNGLWVDHINRDKLDNRGCNLRLVTKSQSAMNRPIGRNKYRGVRKHGDKWVCIFREKYIGTFDRDIDAAMAWNKLAKVKYGKYGVYNSIENC